MTETDLIVVGGIAVTLLLFIVARVGMEIYSKNQNLYKLTDVMVYGGAIGGGLTGIFTIAMIIAYWV
jgi:hypothetical protein